MRRWVAAIAVLVAATACSEDAADETLQPPTTFAGQPESLTTVPDELGIEPAAGEEPTVAPTSIEPSGVTAAELCAGAVLIEPAPEIDTDLLPETSGVAYSRTVDGRMYAHNDSGNLPRLYGIDASSAISEVWTIDAALLDWEDLAVAGTTVYMADTGDNLHLRPNVRLIAAPEPTDDATLRDVTIWRFTYAEGRLDSEALLVEPDGSEAIIVSKGLDNPAGIYVLPLDDPDPEPVTLERVGTLDLGRVISGGDITADGTVVGLRTLDAIWLWQRMPGESIAATLAGDPCEAPSALERQGEAFAFHPDGRGYTTLSERASSTRNDFRLEP